MSEENNPYYTDAEQRREAINTSLDCTKYWPSPREHMVFKGLLAEVARLRADLAQRTAERDEARRMACVSEARLIDERNGLVDSDSPYYANNDEIIFAARHIAAERGWNCFDAKEGKP